MPELWGMPNTPSLPILIGQLWPGVVAPESIYGSNMLDIELFYHSSMCKQMTNFN